MDAKSPKSHFEKGELCGGRLIIMRGVPILRARRPSVRKIMRANNRLIGAYVYAPSPQVCEQWDHGDQSATTQSTGQVT